MTMHCAAASEEIEPLRKAAGRHCGACTLCCYILGVDADNLTKPPDTKCRHCVASEGCVFAQLLASRDGPISDVGSSIYRPGSERRSRRRGPVDNGPVDRRS